MPAQMSHLSTEYVDTPISANVPLAGGTAEVAAILGPTTVPVEQDWVTASIVEVESITYARVLVGPFGPGDIVLETPGDYQWWYRGTAVGSPERPVRKAGVVTIT